MNNIEKLELLFSRLVGEQKLRISEEDKATITLYAENREAGIAFDVLLQAIEEGAVVVSPDQWDSIVEIGLTLQQDPTRWAGVRRAIP